MPNAGGSIVVRGSRVLIDGKLQPASIHVSDGTITHVAERDAVVSDARMVDAGDLVVLPGFVDTHVHVNEPGRTEWEGFETATQAAAAGGVTTLLDMPLNSIPATTDIASLEAKIAAARGNTLVDVGFIGGVVPGNQNALGALARAGVLAFKCFLVPSGVPEFAHVRAEDLRDAMPVLAKLGLPLMAHAEVPDVIEAATLEATVGDPTVYATYLASRPPAAEHEAVALVIHHAEVTGARAHIVHVSSPESTAMIVAARERGVRVTAETCPHYLFFDAGRIPNGATEFKCAPPIRSPRDRDGLWRALEDGALDMIVSDHSPCPPILKRQDAGDFFVAWGGIASLQLGAGAIWTCMRQRNLPIERLAEWMSAAPARLAGLGHVKGRIAPDYDGDLVLFDSDREWTVEANALLHRHRLTPYLGERLVGSVEMTLVRGNVAYGRSQGPSHAPTGRLLLPSIA